MPYSTAKFRIVLIAYLPNLLLGEQRPHTPITDSRLKNGHVLLAMLRLQNENELGHDVVQVC
jgi:hypothetical protein